MSKNVTSFYSDTAQEQKTVSSFYAQETTQGQTQARQQQASQFLQTATPTLNLVQRASFIPQPEKSSVVKRIATAIPGKVGESIRSFWQSEKERRATQTLGQRAVTELVERPAKIAQTPLKAIKWVGQALGEGLSMAGKSVLEEMETSFRALGPDTREEARQKARETPSYQPRWVQGDPQRMEEKLFGSRTTSYQEMKESLDTFLKENNSPEWERKMLITTLPFLMFAADISPYGRVRKALPPKMVKDLLKASDEATARKLLTSIELPPTVVDSLAPRIPAVKTQEQLMEAISTSMRGRVMREVFETTPTTPKVTPRVVTSSIDGVPTPKSALRLTKAEQRVMAQQPSANIDSLRTNVRGRVTDAQAYDVARRLGYTDEKVLAIKVGTSLSKEEATAVSGIVARNLDTLRAMDARIATLDPTEPIALQLRAERAKQYSKTMQLAAVEVGIRSESGRTLEATKRSVAALQDHETMLARILNSEKYSPEAKDWILKQMEGYTGDAKGMVDLMRRINEASLMEKLAEFATAMKLYAPSTHIVNTLTSTLRLITESPIKILAGGINAIEAGLRGTKRERFIIADLVNQNVGQVTAWRESWRNTTKALMDEDFAFKHSLAIQDFSNMRGPAIKGKPWRNNNWDKFLDAFGKNVRMSFRALGVEDAMLRTPAFNAAITTEAGRDALKAGHKLFSKEYKEHMAKFMKDPPLEAVERAQYNAAEVLFQEPLKGFNLSVNQIRNKYPALKLIIPFYRTPVNLIRQSLQFSVLAPVLPSTRQALTADPGQRADALAKMVLGTSLTVPLTMIAMEGRITGAAPTSPAERDKFYNAEGKQPYSIRIGDKWRPINRFAPFAEWFFTAQLLSEAVENGDGKRIDYLIAGLMHSSVRNILDKSYVKGISDLLNAITDSSPDGRNAERYFGNFLAGTFTPTGMGAVARAIDPVYREVDGVLETFLARTPYLSKKLPARLDVYGFEVMRPGGFWSRLISPSIPSVATIDIVTTELEKLGISVGFPAKDFMGFPLTDEEHREVRIAYGRMLYGTLNNLVTSPGWEDMPVRERERAVQQVRSELLKAVRTKVAMQNIVLNELAKELEVRENLNSKDAKERAKEILIQLQEQQQEQ